MRRGKNLVLNTVGLDRGTRTRRTKPAAHYRRLNHGRDLYTCEGCGAYLVAYKNHTKVKAWLKLHNESECAARFEQDRIRSECVGIE